MKLGKQYKIWVGCPEASEVVQRHAFKLGYKWNIAGTEISNTEYPWMVFWDDGAICYGYGIVDFMNDDFTEISIADFLKIAPVEEESKHPEMDAYLNNHLFGDGLRDPHDAIMELHERIKKLEEAHNA